MLETLEETLDQDPFVPLQIVLASGDRSDVSNPHLVAVGKSQITIYPAKTDRFAILRLNQVAALETLEKAA